MDESISRFFEREDTFCAFADHVLPGEHPAEEEHPVRTERTVTISQEALRGDIEGITGLKEGNLPTLVTRKGHNGTGRIDDQLEAMLLVLVNKQSDETSWPAGFENHVFPRAGEVISSPRHGVNMAETVLDIQTYTAPVTTVLDKRTEKDVHVEMKIEGQNRRLAEAAYSTDILSASPGDQHMKEHSNKLTHEEAYYDFTEESFSYLSASNKERVGCKLRR